MCRGHRVGSYAGAAMSELRRSGGADDADKPALNEGAADKPAARPKFELRTTDMDANWPVDRRAVTKTQRAYIESVRKNGGPPPPRPEGIGYVRDWSTGESLDHEYPYITGDKDRTEPDDAPTGETVRDGEPGDTPSVSTPMPPTLQHATATGVERLRAADAAGVGGLTEKGFSGLDGRVFEETDDGWNESLASADDRDAGARPHADVTSPAGIPGELDPDRARETSMTISEARDQIARSRVEPPPDFHRDNSRLEAGVGDLEDEKWHDGLDGPMTGESDSKTKSLLKITSKGSDNVLNVIGGNTEIANGITDRPPLKQVVGQVSPSSQDMPNPVHPPPGVDAATAIASALLTVGAVGSMMHEKYESRKDRHGGNG